jgi:hypothetical protein
VQAISGGAGEHAMTDPTIRAALEAAEEALLRHLWQHDAGYDQAELTAKRIAKIRAYGVDSAWNIRSRGAAAAVAAFHEHMAQHMRTFGRPNAAAEHAEIAAALRAMAEEAGDE